MKISKLFFALLALSLLVTFSACSSDDDDNSIVGTWTFSKAVVTEIKTNSSENDSKIKAYLEEILKTDFKEQKMTFTEDGKVSVSSPETEPFSLNGTFTFKDGVLAITWDYGDDGQVTVKNAAAIDKNNLNIAQDYLDDIEDLTSSELKEIGITDPNFKATKAMIQITMVR